MLLDRKPEGKAQDSITISADERRHAEIQSRSLAAPSARTSGTFVIYRTYAEGRSSRYAVGRYEDKRSRAHGGWLLRQRIVSLKTRLLSIPRPVPLQAGSV